MALLHDLNAEEVTLVMNCPSCSAELRCRWADPEYKALRERNHATHIHDEILNGEKKRKLRSYRPGRLRSEGG